MFSRPTLAKDTEEGKEDACNNCDRVRGPRLPSRRAETQLLKSVRTRAAAREEGEGKGDRKEEARAKGERGRRKRGQRGERENPISVHPSAWGTKPNGTTEKKSSPLRFYSSRSQVTGQGEPRAGHADHTRPGDTPQLTPFPSRCMGRRVQQVIRPDVSCFFL